MLHIVYIFSNNWLSYIIVQLEKLARHNTGRMHIYLVGDGLNEHERDYLEYALGDFRRRISVEIIDARLAYQKHITSNINVTPNFTRFTLYRLLLPSLLPSSVDKILYIDADTLVTGPLQKLYGTNMGNNLIAAVSDAGAAERKQQLGFSKEEQYFNAGVLLLNLRQIRRENLEPLWLKMVNENQYPWPDQDILNITCRKRVKWLPRQYNSFGPKERGQKETVIHYIVQKPWRNHTVPRFLAWQKARSAFDRRKLRIPKILHIIAIEGEKETVGKFRIRTANAEMLDDFEIHMHCLDLSRIASNASWKSLHLQKKFDELRLAAAKQFIAYTGGVYLDDRLILSQAIDPLLRYDSFSLAWPETKYAICFGSVPEITHKIPNHNRQTQSAPPEILAKIYFRGTLPEPWWCRFFSGRRTHIS